MEGLFPSSYYLSDLTKRNSVSQNHLQRHVEQFCYRYSLRNIDPIDTFEPTTNRRLGVMQ